MPESLPLRTDTPDHAAADSVDTLRDHPAASRARRPTVPTGFTVADVARRYRVGEDKVRAFIARGELLAINTATALCGRPRWIILPDALAAFEKRREGGPPPKTARRRKRPSQMDYYP